MPKKSFSYITIADAIYQEFIQYKLKTGDVLPTEYELIEYYKVSRTTIRRSIKKLAEDNLVYTVQGSGAFVKGEKQEYKIFELTNFYEYVQKVGGTPRTEVLGFEIIEAPEEIAKILQVKEGTAIYKTKRVRYIDEIPVIVEVGYLPVALFPELSVKILSQSKYYYIEQQKNMIIKNSHFIFDPIILDKETAMLLQTRPLLPTICIKTIAFLENGNIFEYTEAIRNNEKYMIMIDVNRHKNIN